MTDIATMKARCIDATETFRKMPVTTGPSSYSAYWPEMPWVWGDDKGKLNKPIRFVPTSTMIAEAEEFAGWINAHLNEIERKAIRQWAALKTSRNRTIRGYCAKIGMQEHNYRREIDEIFQKLVFTVYGIPGALCSPDVDEGGKSGEKEARSENCWRDDESFRRRQLIKGLLEKSERRIGSRTRAA